MEQEICNINDVKTTNEILQYISSTSDDISGAPMQELNHLLKSMSCMLPSEDNIGDESYIIPEKDYEPLQKILGMMYDTFAENSTIPKEQFVENLFNVSTQFGKENKNEVVELVGGVKKKNRSTPPPPSEKVTHVKEEQSQEAETPKELISADELVATIIPKKLLTTGMMIVAIQFAKESNPVYIVLAYNAPTVISMFGKLTIGVTSYIVGDNVNKLRNFVHKSITDSATIISEYLNNNAFLNFITSFLSNFANKISFATRYFISITLLPIMGYFFADMVLRCVTSSVTSTNMAYLNALSGGWDVIMFTLYALINNKTAVLEIVPKIIHIIKPIIGNRCAITTGGLRTGFDFVDKFHDNLKTLGEGGNAFQCVQTQTLADFSIHRENAHLFFSTTLPLLQLALQVFLFIYPNNDKLRSVVTQVDKRVSILIDWGKKLSNKLQGIGTPEYENSHAIFEQKSKDKDSNNENENQDLKNELSTSNRLLSLRSRTPTPNGGGKSRRRKVKKQKKKTRKQHKRKTRKSGKKKANKRTTKKR